MFPNAVYEPSSCIQTTLAAAQKWGIPPDHLNLDMKPLREIDKHKPRQVIVRNICNVADDLGIRVIAEGVGTEAGSQSLRSLGITLFQGHYFGRPAFERCAQPFIPA